MYGLIVAVVSIALVALLSLASSLYLGNTWSSASVRAQADQFVNASTQVTAAARLYQTDTGKDLADPSDVAGSSVDALVSGSYLTAPPQIPPMAKTGSKWRVSQVSGHPVVSIELDDAAPATAKMCAEAAKTGGGCVSDLSTLSTN